VRDTVAAYVSLMKLRVVELLLVTTLPAMVLAQRGLPPLDTAIITLIGGTLAAGSAHAFNQVLERDIDAVMHRTRRRAVARAVVSPRAGFTFASLLLVASVLMMIVWVNPLAAALTLAANLFYVVVYTVLLKRRTSQNIVWGGVAGCLPTFIGWAAITESLDWPPVLLFLIVFFWTPPHYWPLAMRYRDDYARAGVPMLPVVASARTVAAQILGAAPAQVATDPAGQPVVRVDEVGPRTGAPFHGQQQRAQQVGDLVLVDGGHRTGDDVVDPEPVPVGAGVHLDRPWRVRVGRAGEDVDRDAAVGQPPGGLGDRDVQAATVTVAGLRQRRGVHRQDGDAAQACRRVVGDQGGGRSHVSAGPA
jgi:protoheme IX farnesyltransferase